MTDGNVVNVGVSDGNVEGLLEGECVSVGTFEGDNEQGDSIGLQTMEDFSFLDLY